MSRRDEIADLKKRLAALEEEEALTSREAAVARREAELARRERALRARETAADTKLDPVSRLYAQHAIEAGVVTPYGAPIQKNTLQELVDGDAMLEMPPERPADPDWRSRVEPGVIRRGDGGGRGQR